MLDDEVRLLEEAQSKSAYFKDYTPQEITLLATDVFTTATFRTAETVFQKYDQATMLVLVLRGSMQAMLDSGQKLGTERGTGEIMGEMALFNGGRRGATVVAGANGCVVAALGYEHLDALGRRHPKLAMTLNTQLAHAALAKQLEGTKRPIESLSRDELNKELRDLMQRQVAQHWERRLSGAAAETTPARESLLLKKPSFVTSLRRSGNKSSSRLQRATSGGNSRCSEPSEDEAPLPALSKLPSEMKPDEALALLHSLVRKQAHGGAGTAARWLLQLEADDLRVLASHSACAAFSVGEPVLVRGEAPVMVGLVLRGSVGYLSRASGRLVVRGAGEFVGESALFSGAPRDADAYAIEDGLLAMVSLADLRLLEELAPPLASLLLGALCASTRRRGASELRAEGLDALDEEDLANRFKALGWEAHGGGAPPPLECFCRAAAQGEARRRVTNVSAPARGVISQTPPPEAVQLLLDCVDAAPWLAEAGLTLGDLAQLARLVGVVRVAPGDVVMRQGQPATFVCLVLSGQLDVHGPPTLKGASATPPQRIGVGCAVGYAPLFEGGCEGAAAEEISADGGPAEGGERAGDVLGAALGYVAVVSYADLCSLSHVESSAAAKLVRLLAVVMYTHILNRHDGQLSTTAARGELTTDLAVRGKRAPRDKHLKPLLDEMRGWDWPAKLARTAAEELFERIKFRRRDDFSDSPAAAYPMRVLAPGGGSVVVSLFLEQTIAGALQRIGARLTRGGGGTFAAGEWVLQAPSTGEVFRPSLGDAVLSDTACVAECLEHGRTPLLRLCTRRDAESYLATLGYASGGGGGTDSELEAQEATRQLIGPRLKWSSESFEAVAFRAEMRRLRPSAQVEHAAATVWRKLPQYREAEPPLSTLPKRFKVTVNLSSMTKTGDGEVHGHQMSKGLQADVTTSVAELRDRALQSYVKATNEEMHSPERFVLKVVGSNEYLEEGSVLDYTYVRQCLKGGKPVSLALVDHPTANLPPLPPPPPSEAAHDPAASAPPTLSLWDMPPAAKLRVRVHSVEDIRAAAEALPGRVRGAGCGHFVLLVRVGIYQGGQLLCPLVETAPLPCDDDANPAWGEWLTTELATHAVPRAARVCLTLLARPASGGSKKDEVALGWVSKQLVEHDDLLVAGMHSLRLWPGEEANPIGCNMENIATAVQGPPAPLLAIAFDTYALPVAMPLEPTGKYRGIGEHPSAEQSAKLRELAQRDPLTPLGAADRQLLWRFRGFILTSSAALPKFLQCCDWGDRDSVVETHELLRSWAPLRPLDALELLDAKFADREVRSYAVACLERITDAQLGDLVLQLTQVLKYEARHDSALARMLLARSLANPHQVGHRFFWSLMSEMHLAEVSERFGLLLEEYLRCCGPHRGELLKMAEVESLLIRAAKLVQTEPKSHRIQVLRQELASMAFPERFQVALDPRIECSGLVVEKCRCMDSKKVPLWLVFTNADPLGRNHTVMYKSGDDLRQDALTLQIIRIMEHQWEREGLDLRLSPYGCVATGDEKGFIEIVLNSDTTANITKRYSGGATGAFSKEPMARFLKEHNPTNSEYGEAVETFLRSLAGYCVATYVIGIGDRHNDNVMLSRKGHLFHIDFGHFLGNFKSKLGVKRERAPFVFTPDFAYVLGDKGHPIFERFIDTCCSAYSIVRKHTHLLINLFSLMLSTGIPELRNAEDIDWLRRCLQLEMSEAEAADHFTKQIYVALATRTTQLNNAVHIIAHS